MALLLMQELGSSETHWGIGGYRKEQIETLQSEIAALGIPLSYEIDGVAIVIEPHFAKLLLGKTLDCRSGRFTAVESANGI